ncbi:MAG: MBL fold metallo-hydrolase RNA specificity domain-containing protein [Christensenellales bacterium]
MNPDSLSFELHTSGHATVSDIHKVIEELKPKQIIPITYHGSGFICRFF